MIVRFVDIGGIVDHHCLNFPFMTLHMYRTYIELVGLCDGEKLLSRLVG